MLGDFVLKSLVFAIHRVELVGERVQAAGREPADGDGIGVDGLGKLLGLFHKPLVLELFDPHAEGRDLVGESGGIDARVLCGLDVLVELGVELIRVGGRLREIDRVEAVLERDRGVEEVLLERVRGLLCPLYVGLVV